jgi:hypothetical protein
MLSLDLKIDGGLQKESLRMTGYGPQETIPAMAGCVRFLGTAVNFLTQ